MITKTSFKKFITDPTTIFGLGSAAATAVLSFCSGVAWQVDVAGFVFSAVLVAMPGNTTTAGDIRQAVADTLEVVMSKGKVGSAAVVLEDVMKVEADLTPQTTVTVTQTLPKN